MKINKGKLYKISKPGWMWPSPAMSVVLHESSCCKTISYENPNIIETGFALVLSEATINGEVKVFIKNKIGWVPVQLLLYV